MQRIKLNKGDDAWIYLSHHNGKLTKGKCIEVLNLDGYSMEHYVIEVLTPVDPLLEIRSGSSVSDHPDKPIGMWRRNVDTERKLRSKIEEACRDKTADSNKEVSPGE